MKRISVFLPALMLVFALAVTAGMWGLFGTKKASAEAYGGDFRYAFIGYDLTYDVAENRKISVTEIMTVNFTGRDSTGFIRDIPVNAGEQVRNVRVKKLETGEEKSAVYYVDHLSGEDGTDFLSVDIGDSSHKFGLTETYILKYDYCLTKAQENKAIGDGYDYLSLNTVPAAHDGIFYNVNVTVNLPQGFKAAYYYSGKAGGGSGQKLEAKALDGGLSQLYMSFDMLGANEGVTFDIRMEQGSLSVFFDFTPYWFAIALAALIALMALIKVMFFHKDILAPVVNFEAPDNMDPLIMGKLIDNKVNSEDVTALIFYWADKGYVKINLDDKDDPTIIRIKNLPATAEPYEQVVFAGLFRNSDSVRPSQLKYNFYSTFERATAMVNDKNRGLFKSSSIGVSILFALIAGIIMGLAPMLMGMITVSHKLVYFLSFISLLPALVLYGFTETLAYNRYKYRGKKKAVFLGLTVLAVAALTALYTLLIPDMLLTVPAKIAISGLGFVAVAAAVMLISRTPEYNKKLGDIIGFRNFILYAEKDRLEKLIESDPQFYYHILPYAQVLGVSGVWENKFKDLAVPPPAWATYSSADFVFDFIILNSLIRNSTLRIANDMISRPSSSGGSGHGGFGGGGFGGGHVGGGHGGGGVRGR